LLGVGLGGNELVVDWIVINWWVFPFDAYTAIDGRITTLRQDKNQ
jgi:hypothetical protein